MQSVENVTFWKLEYFFLCIIRLFVFVFGAFFFFFSFKSRAWGWVVGVGGYVCLALCVWKCWVQANLHTKTKKWWQDFRCKFGVCVCMCVCVCVWASEWVHVCVGALYVCLALCVCENVEYRQICIQKQRNGDQILGVDLVCVCEQVVEWVSACVCVSKWLSEWVHVCVGAAICCHLSAVLNSTFLPSATLFQGTFFSSITDAVEGPFLWHVWELVFRPLFHYKYWCNFMFTTVFVFKMWCLIFGVVCVCNYITAQCKLKDCLIWIFLYYVFTIVLEL